MLQQDTLLFGNTRACRQVCCVELNLQSCHYGQLKRFSFPPPASRAHAASFCSLPGLKIRMETKVNLALREDASAKDRLQAMFQVRFPGRLPAVSEYWLCARREQGEIKTKACLDSPHGVDTSF